MFGQQIFVLLRNYWRKDHLVDRPRQFTEAVWLFKRSRENVESPHWTERCSGPPHCVGVCVCVAGPHGTSAVDEAR